VGKRTRDCAKQPSKGSEGDRIEQTTGFGKSGGPYPVKDSFGMGVAAMMLMRSLDTGKNAKTIQNETMRKLWGHYSNFVHTIPEGVGASTTSSEGASSSISLSKTNGYWFKRFMHGCHKRMGDAWTPDRPLTMEELSISVGRRLATLRVERQQTSSQNCTHGCLVDVGFCRWFARRINSSHRSGTHSETLEGGATPHVPLAMAGWFKKHVGENQSF